MARYQRNPNNVYEQYYQSQAGGNGMPYFQGSPYQRGHGIGSFLGGLFRGALPLLKSGARAIGKELLQCGINVLDDLPDKDLKDSMNERTGEAAKNLKRKAINSIFGNMSGKGYKTKRRRKSAQLKSITRRKKTKKAVRSKKPHKSAKQRKVKKTVQQKKTKKTAKRRTSKARDKYSIVSQDIFS